MYICSFTQKCFLGRIAEREGRVLMQRRGMPSKREIFAYWCDHEKFVKLDITVGNSDCCMACGFHFYVERCHLKAVSNGGSNDVSNLHILCKNCHTESEMLNKEYYWTWPKSFMKLLFGCQFRMKNKLKKSFMSQRQS